MRGRPVKMSQGGGIRLGRVPRTDSLSDPVVDQAQAVGGHLPRLPLVATGQADAEVLAVACDRWGGPRRAHQTRGAGHRATSSATSCVESTLASRTSRSTASRAGRFAWMSYSAASLHDRRTLTCSRGLVGRCCPRCVHDSVQKIWPTPTPSPKRVPVSGSSSTKLRPDSKLSSPDAENRSPSSSRAASWSASAASAPAFAMPTTAFSTSIP